MLKHKIVAIMGAGFIGKNLIRNLLKLKCEIRVLDHNECPKEFENKVFWIKSGFKDQEALKSLLDANIDVVYHMISSTIPGSEADNKITQELYDNVFTTIEFLNVCKVANVKRIVFISSSSVYGVQNVFPIKESAETNPISAHGIQKLTVEKYLQLYQYIDNMDVKIVRLSNPYGPGQNIFGKQGFIALVIGNLLSNKAVLLRNNGMAVRDFIYIDDVVEALKIIGFKTDIPLLMNIGSGISHELNDVVNIIERFTGKKLEKLNGEARKIDIPVSVLDISLAKDKLNFSPEVTLSTGIKLTLMHHGLIDGYN